MLLQNIHSPQDLKQLPADKLPQLSDELRRTIIDVVGTNGGHLASNLGVVELTIALHRVFDSPTDAIVWDVSHQCYAHKLLTGRYQQFPTLRTKNGISGFTRTEESKHDYFDAGHASSSISSALGLLTAWQLTGRDDKVVAVIGDGALTGGMAYEALNHAGQLARNLIVVVNDNQMSISKNTGAVSRYLSRLTMTTTYQNFRYKFDRLIDRIPYFSRHLGKFIYRFKRGLKGLLLTNNLFVDLGFEYAGPLDGHNIQQLEKIFTRAKKIHRPMVIHIVTKKGKGYVPAENDPSTFHGVSPFSISDGVVEKLDVLSFTEAFSAYMVQAGQKNSRIAAITAAMSKGTGLDAFARKFPSRFFDVGIAEEHAVTFAGGLAAGGMIPFVAIYSTFIQRSIDQIIEDLALSQRHAILLFDRAGAVPGDGETHQGVFDIALLRSIPGITLMTVTSAKDMALCLDWAIKQEKGPIALRWPKASCPSEIEAFARPVHLGRGLYIRSEEYAPAVASRLQTELETKSKKAKQILVVCTGGLYAECLTACRSLLLTNVLADMYVLRFIKPFDESYFVSIASRYDAVLIAEDGLMIGGVASYIADILKDNEHTRHILVSVNAFEDAFFANASRAEILEQAGLSGESLAKKALSLVENAGKRHNRR